MPRRTRALAPTLAIVLALAGCGSDAGPAADGELETEEVPPAVDAGLVVEDAAPAAGPAGVSGVLPSDFPLDVPLYSPSSLVDFGAGPTGLFVLFFSPDPADGVLQQLRRELSGRGWEAGDEATWSKGNRQVRVLVSGQAAGTEIRIEY